MTAANAIEKSIRERHEQLLRAAAPAMYAALLRLLGDLEPIAGSDDWRVPAASRVVLIEAVNLSRRGEP